MNLVLLNFVWSGVLIGESFIRFWYIIPATIVIEMVIIKLMTSHPWGKSLLISTVGNLVSGIIETIVIGCASILMFAGSFGLEYLTVRWIFKDKSRAVMWAILSGNVLSYCFIVISLLVKYWIK